MIELNKIYNENCLITMSERMPDNFIDLTVTSPPYDNLRDYNGYSFDFEKVAKELYRVTKNGGVVVWVVGDATVNGSESGTSFKQALYFKDIGFRLHDTMIYAKRNTPPLNHNRYEQQFEYMFIFSKGKPAVTNLIKENSNNPGHINRSTRRNGQNKDGLVKAHGYGLPVYDTKVRGNIFYYIVGSANDKAGAHPAIFPEQLAKEMVYTWSNSGDLVYDPFAGSGTTLKMAHLQNRQWIGSEISKEYCELAEKRIAPYLAQKSLF